MKTAAGGKIIRDYVHEKLDKPVDAVSGHYVFVKENRLHLGGRDILYLVGYGVIDTSCCGPGGCGFALVPGYIVSWKYALDEEGRDISRVEPVTDRSVRDEVDRWIQKNEAVNQVQFL